MISKPEKKFLIKYVICRLIGLLASVIYFYIIDNVSYFDITIMIILPFAVFQLLNGESPLSFYTTISFFVYKYLFGGDEMRLYTFIIYIFALLIIIILDEILNKDTWIFIYELIKREIKGSDKNA